MVDDRAQVVVHAAAHGSGHEGHLLAPLLEDTREAFHVLDAGEDILKRTKITADSGFQSKAVIAAVEAIGADTYVADRDYRKREPAFADAARHKERDRKERALKRRLEREAQPKKEGGLFTLKDLQYHAANATCLCPGGHRMYQAGKNMLFNGYRVARFKAPKTACRDYHLRPQCLRHPERTVQRQLTVIKDREGPPPKKSARAHGPTERMRWKFDTPAGRELYSRRMGTVEPVFGNLQNKGMRRPPRSGKGECPVAAICACAQYREDRGRKVARIGLGGRLRPRQGAPRAI